MQYIFEPVKGQQYQNLQVRPLIAELPGALVHVMKVLILRISRSGSQAVYLISHHSCSAWNENLDSMLITTASTNPSQARLT